MAQFETLSAYLGRLLTVDTLTLLAFWSLLAFVLRKRVRKLSSLSSIEYFWVSLSLVGILAFTLRIWDYSGNDPIPWPLNLELWSQALHIDANWILNAILFAPAAFILVFIGKNPWKAALILSALSALIETTQQLSMRGISDPSDWCANTVGTLVGVFVAELLLLTNITKRYAK